MDENIQKENNVIAAIMLLAHREVVSRNHNELRAEHLLLALVHEKLAGTHAYGLLTRAGITYGVLSRYSPKRTHSEFERIDTVESAEDVGLKAQSEAAQMEMEVDSCHFLLGILSIEGPQSVHGLLIMAGADPEILRILIRSRLADIKESLIPAEKIDFALVCS